MLQRTQDAAGEIPQDLTQGRPSAEGRARPNLAESGDKTDVYTTGGRFRCFPIATFNRPTSLP